MTDPLSAIFALIILSSGGVLVFSRNRLRDAAILLVIITIVATHYFGARATPTPLPNATAEKTAVVSQSSSTDDDIKPAHHPDWKLEDERWDGHFERPIAPAPRIKVSCWEYGDECGIPGGACGKLRKLSDLQLYREECDALRSHRPQQRPVYATPRRAPRQYAHDRNVSACPRGGCPTEQEE